MLRSPHDIVQKCLSWASEMHAHTLGHGQYRNLQQQIYKIPGVRNVWIYFQSLGRSVSRDLEILKYFWMSLGKNHASGDSRRIRSPAFARSPRIRIKIMSQHFAKPPELGATSCQSRQCFMKIQGYPLFLSISHWFWVRTMDSKKN